MAWNWRNPFGLERVRTVDVPVQSLAGWTVETRPQHLLRFEELRSELAASIFSPTTHTSQASRAYFWIAGLINNQLALMQKAGLLDTEGERVLRTAFPLGYLFGVAAWFSDEVGIARPSADADQLHGAPDRRQSEAGRGYGTRAMIFS